MGTNDIGLSGHKEPNLIERIYSSSIWHLHPYIELALTVLEMQYCRTYCSLSLRLV